MQAVAREILYKPNPLPNIPFWTNVFVLTRVKSKAKSPIAQKVLVEKEMFGTGTVGDWLKMILGVSVF